MSETSLAPYDLAIIGGGPGGYVTALRAAAAGQRVALIEQHEPGGVCLHTGCIPTKTMAAGVGLLRRAQAARLAGLTLDPEADHLSEINQRRLNNTQYVIRMPKPGCCPWHCCMYSRYSEEYLKMEWKSTDKAEIRWAKKEQWLSDRQAAEAIDFFRARERDGRRFYVNLAFSAPHLPIEGVPPYVDAAR